MPAAWFGDRPPELTGSLQPLCDYNFGVGQRFLACGTIRHAPRKFRHFGDDGFILRTPGKNNPVSGQ
jgi:hypothetical protein